MPRAYVTNQPCKCIIPIASGNAARTHSAVPPLGQLCMPVYNAHRRPTVVASIRGEIHWLAPIGRIRTVEADQPIAARSR
jgi:hypothetical protein